MGGDATATGDAETGGADTGTDTGGKSCVDNAECDVDEVCDIDGSCTWAPLAAYEVRVPSWDPWTCDGGPFDGDADLWWLLSLGGAQVGASGWVQGGCPGSWPNTTACAPAGSFADAFDLKLYDKDNDGSELHDRLWWDGDKDSTPDPLNPWYLHVGEFDDTTGSDGHVRVVFTVVSSCN